MIFCQIISAFHDLGLTTDDPVPAEVKNLRQLAISRFAKVPKRQQDPSYAEMVKRLTEGVPKDSSMLIEELLSRVDFGYMKGDKAKIEESCRRIIKSLLFLGFFDDS